MPDFLYETRLQGIMVVVFSIAKSSICFVEYNSHDSLQARLIERAGHAGSNRAQLLPELYYTPSNYYY